MLDRILCSVIFESDALRFGEFANAFRVMTDVTGEVVLDFCIFSANDNIAKVVARIRVHRTLVALLDVRIGEAIVELDARSKNSPPMSDGSVFVFADGAGLLVGHGSDEIH